MLVMLVSLLAACSTRRTQAPHVPHIGEKKTGEASWYGVPYHGRRAANGEIYDMEKLTAAHRSYAFDTWLRVKNLDNDKSVVVRVTDRGPFAHHRIIDLSKGAARESDMLRTGVAKVRIEVVRPPDDKADKQADKAPGKNGGDNEDKGVEQDGNSGKNANARNASRYEGAPTSPETATRATGKVTSEPTNAEANAIPVPEATSSEIPSATARFTLQAGAFRAEANARELAERLKKFSTTVRIAYDERASMWRVTVGAFATVVESGELASTLRKEGVETFIVVSDR